MKPEPPTWTLICTVLPSPSTNLWKISEHFWHFISPFTTAYIDNNITIGIFGKGLGNNCLSTTKRPRNSSSTSLNTPRFKKKFILNQKKTSWKMLCNRGLCKAISNSIISLGCSSPFPSHVLEGILVLSIPEKTALVTQLIFHPKNLLSPGYKISNLDL